MNVSYLYLLFGLQFINVILGSYPSQLEVSRLYISTPKHADDDTPYNDMLDGNYDAALSNYNDKLFGPNSRSFLQQRIRVSEVYNHQGIIYLRQKKYDYSLKALKRSLSLKEDVSGSESIVSGFLLNNIASLYLDRADPNTKPINDLDEAVNYYTKALNVFNRNKYFNPDARYQRATQTQTMKVAHNITLANIYHNLGLVYRKKKEYHESIYHFGRAIYLQNNTVGVGFYSHVQAETYYYLGITYDDQGKYREGLDAYLKASKIDLTIAGKDTWKLEKQVIGHIVYRANQKRYVEARDYLFNMLHTKINSKSSGLGSYGVTTGITYMLLGGTFEEPKNYTEALHYYNAASQIFTSHLKTPHHELHDFDSIHIFLMDTYNKMGLASERDGDISNAKKYFNYAVNITEGYHLSIETSHWNRSSAWRSKVLGERFTDKDLRDTFKKSLYAANVYSNQAALMTNSNPTATEQQEIIDLLKEAISIRTGELQAMFGTTTTAMLGHNYYHVAEAILGSSQCASGTDESRNYLALAHTIYVNVLGSKHLSTRELAGFRSNRGCL